MVLLFICANLTLGITFSSIARNQLQAMQISMFYMMPSMFFSGFMFPFAGLPVWAQVIGDWVEDLFEGPAREPFGNFRDQRGPVMFVN